MVGGGRVRATDNSISAGNRDEKSATIIFAESLPLDA